MNNNHSNSSTNSTNSNSSSNSSSVSTISEIPTQFSNGITFSLGPFELAGYFLNGYHDDNCMKGSDDPSICTPVSPDRYFFKASDTNQWSGVHFKFGENTSLLKVSLRIDKARSGCKPLHPAPRNLQEEYNTSCGYNCCGHYAEDGHQEYSECGRNTTQTYNLRITVGDYLLCPDHEGISVVSGTIIEKRHKCYKFDTRREHVLTGTYVKFDPSKPFYILRVKTGHILIRNDDGEWAFDMKEVDYLEGFKLAFYNCSVFVEAINSESKFVEDIITDGSKYYEENHGYSFDGEIVDFQNSPKIWYLNDLM
jgi:hypothetical protein